MLVSALGPPLDKGCPKSTGTRRTSTSTLRNMPLGLSNATLKEPEELSSIQGGWAVLPLVWLPMALYVRSTSHLYEMLERLQLRAPGNGNESSSRGTSGKVTPSATGSRPGTATRSRSEAASSRPGSAAGARSSSSSRPGTAGRGKPVELPPIERPGSGHRGTTKIELPLLGPTSSPKKLRSKRSHDLGDVEGLRALLDRDERRYSYLVFAITAAFQALLFARAQLGKSFPLALLASSPPDPEMKRPNGYPIAAPHDFPRTHPIFRGIWIRGEVDEERARYQYSFQSFSRAIEGVAQVLAFYASVADGAAAHVAAEHKHILILVARAQWERDDCLALPVQLFDGPRESGSECEVLLPPYVRYEFDDELAITSADFDAEGPLPKAQAKLERLSEKWRGFKLPELLMSMLSRNSVSEKFPEIDALRPFVTVRFVRSISVPEPLSGLFESSSNRLYDFQSAEEQSPLNAR
eukprot:gnl/TRDRNA2_/TRDRNA2_150635_c1_seq1.p1 gnl/TRDRNA2_/TRDRNA2_150635_c1~~gnl/TRDRNA2_/TRDRNA2_150635_c1_seq1.p1  ORF type:complete len:503 (-),score=69.03 gnl/TRDRNA2_/TRDRNA2_150635_c1_seq1:54-1454(-)